MVQKKVAPYGSWLSPITSDLIVSETIGLVDIALDGNDFYWLEMRPAEKGRYVIVKRSPDGSTIDITPQEFNVRTRVHEYGGGSFIILDGVIYFSNFSDQRLYKQSPGSKPEPITPESKLRYADTVIDRKRGRIICICEDHTHSEREAINKIVSIDINGKEEIRTLVSGNDFYSTPRLSPDGDQLAWLTWNHPNMPWDGTELWVAEVKADGTLGEYQLIAGGKNESIFQPEWSPDGTLYFSSDKTGWWNIYRWRDKHIENVYEKAAEFGAPQWVFGMSIYVFESADRIICAYNEQGTWHLASLDTRSRKLEIIETPYTEIWKIRLKDNQLFFCGGSPTEPSSIIKLDLSSRKTEVLKRSNNVEIDPGYISVPRLIEFPTENNLSAYAFFYAPQNRDYRGPEDEEPPLLVISHGGPTGATSTTLDLDIQYWTSLGIAVLDVNYGGSTGYGRAYRERLTGQWGIVDVNDCINGACFLADRGEVDSNRLIIRGGSAGGYTTLCALTFHHLFKAGASYYGISDLEALETDSHKFESRYSHSLIGPYPERKDLYIERSPIHFSDQLSCPLILFQGLEDKVVPPNQAVMMYEAVKAKGLPVAYVPFEGEQHGFRKAENIKRALDGELYFYSKVFNFDLARKVDPVQIENLEDNLE